MQLTIVPSENKIPSDKLISGEIDFVLGFSHEIESSSTIDSQVWLSDSYCTIARKGHPELKSGLTLDTFLKLSHVRISPWGEKQGIVDHQLNKAGFKRQIALQLPSVMAAPYTVANSDLVLTMPRLVAEHIADVVDIDIFQPPIDIPDYQLKLYWHKLNASKGSHRWLSELVTALANY